MQQKEKNAEKEQIVKELEELGVSETLSKRIADMAVGMDGFSLLKKIVFNDPLLFASTVVMTLKAETGSDIKELLTGMMCRVFSFNGKRFVNFENDNPAVFRCKDKLYIYERKI